jgi:hypothetical protein
LEFLERLPVSSASNKKSKHDDADGTALPPPFFLRRRSMTSAKGLYEHKCLK